jgi:hypothetical protein
MDRQTARIYRWIEVLNKFNIVYFIFTNVQMWAPVSQHFWARMTRARLRTMDISPTPVATRDCWVIEVERWKVGTDPRVNLDVENHGKPLVSLGKWYRNGWMSTSMLVYRRITSGHGDFSRNGIEPPKLRMNLGWLFQQILSWGLKL